MLHTSDHKYAQKLHAMRRVYQRYGILIEPVFYNQFSKSIAEGKYPSVGPGRVGGTRHIIKHKGKELVAVFDEETQQIATFLPKGSGYEVSTDEKRTAGG